MVKKVLKILLVSVIFIFVLSLVIRDKKKDEIIVKNPIDIRNNETLDSVIEDRSGIDTRNRFRSCH